MLRQIVTSAYRERKAYGLLKSATMTTQQFRTSSTTSLSMVARQITSRRPASAKSRYSRSQSLFASVRACSIGIADPKVVLPPLSVVLLRLDDGDSRSRAPGTPHSRLKVTGIGPCDGSIQSAHRRDSLTERLSAASNLHSELSCTSKSSSYVGNGTVVYQSVYASCTTALQTRTRRRTNAIAMCSGSP